MKNLTNNTIRLSHGHRGPRDFEGNWIGWGLLPAAALITGWVAW